MRRLSRHHRWLHFAGLGVSAAALAGLVQLENVWAHAGVDEVDEAISAATVDEREEILEPHALLAVARTPAQITGALGALPTAEPAAAEPAAPVVATAQPTDDESEVFGPGGLELVAVPDLSGLGVHKAVKALNRAGLKVRVRDESGWRLGAYDWAYFKVESQKIEAGTMVLPGSRIALKAEPKPMKYAQGY